MSVRFLKFIELAFDELEFYYTDVNSKDDSRAGSDWITVVRLGLGDEADALLAASSVPEMRTAAQRLRSSVLGVRQRLMRPLPTDSIMRWDPSLPNPEIRPLELADLATDVVTAVDYLLSMLGGSDAAYPRLVLAGEVGSDRGQGRSDEDALDRLSRRRLDARGIAVRLGMRLFAELHRDLANG